MLSSKKIFVLFWAGIVLFLLYGIQPFYTSAQTPISQNAEGFLDKPFSGTTLSGNQNVYGWLLDISGIENIDVLVDGTVVGQATYGDARPDVLKAYPQFNNGNSGFHFDLDTTKYSDGQHTVTVKATGKNGYVTTLSNRSITTQNTIGFLDRPTNGTTLSGNQNVYGWLLDMSGIENIDVLVDGTVVGQATYGDARPDVLKAYPQFNNGNSGFHFDLDTTKYSDGQHTVTVKATGKNGYVTTLSNRSITTQNTIGFLDRPTNGTTLSGNQNVYGWLLDMSGIENIDVLVDGTVVGQATYGDARPDVLKAYPQFNNGNSGFHFDLDTTKYSDGQHTVTVKATGKNGYVTTLSNRSITTQNTIGFLDRPTNGTTLSGNQNVYGWLLDMSGIENIDVLVDGTVVGQATYGDARPDVLKAYPQFNNGNSGFHFDLDTTKYSDGQHTVTVKATGKNGYVTILSNRTITIQNALGILDRPVANSTIGETFNVYGWFLDMNGVKSIDVLVDGSVVGQAIYGDARPDVLKAYPQFNNGNAGFHFSLNTNNFSGSQHTITIKVTNNNGRVTTLPNKAVTFKQAVFSVFLDPGHGGTDSGAIAGGYREADLNLAVSLKVQKLLLNRGYIVYMSRTGNTTIGLLERSIMTNELNPDIFISLHHNSTGDGTNSANGIESYYYQFHPDYPSKINENMHNNPERIKRSASLTNIIQQNLISYTGANNRGTDGDTLSVLRESTVPATLLELGFINNTLERQKLITEDYQNKLAKAIADGIDQYFRMYPN